jgi:hypothetical protein
MLTATPSAQIAGLHIQLLDTDARIDRALDRGSRIPVEMVEWSAVYGVPAVREGVSLIVPLVTALAILASSKGRDDLLVPYHQVRDTEGTVVGCRLLAHPC